MMIFTIYPLTKQTIFFVNIFAGISFTNSFVLSQIYLQYYSKFLLYMLLKMTFLATNYL